MSQHFPRISLLSKQNSVGARVTLEGLLTLLLHRGHQLFLDQNTAKLLHQIPKEVVVHHEKIAASDLVIVIGGDGSLLHAAQWVVDRQIPMLGINRGRLGFLTDLYPTEINSKLISILEGHFQTETRYLLKIQQKTPETAEFGLALNDVVVRSLGQPSLMEFDVFIDNQFVCSYRADGLIAATPTGSTAYSLSAGGPILHPSLNILLLVPMFAHTLSARPIIIDGRSEVTIALAKQNRFPAQVIADGRAHETILNPGTVLKLTQHPEPLQLIHPQDYNYFETLRSKLHWGSQR